MKNEKKLLSELNMMDSFLFSKITEEKGNAELIARLIIERVMGIKIDSITIDQEKSILGVTSANKGIRMDLYVTERENGNIIRVYDIEPNNYRDYNLPKRNRYYQSLNDSRLLASSGDYNELPEFVSIWILPYDPFGKGRMIYKVKNMIEEFPEIEYNDGVTKIFLYVDGEIGGSEELRALLTYMKDTCESNAVDLSLKMLQDIVVKLKHNPKVGEHYMTWQELIEFEKAAARKIAREEGLQEGREEGLQEGREEGREEGRKEGREEGRKEGRKEGREEGREEAREESKNLILQSLLKLNYDNDSIISILVTTFGMTKEEALTMLDN